MNFWLHSCALFGPILLSRNSVDLELDVEARSTFFSLV